MDYKPEVKEYMNTLPKFLQTAIVDAKVKINSVDQLKALEEAYKANDALCSKLNANLNV